MLELELSVFARDFLLQDLLIRRHPALLLFLSHPLGGGVFIAAQHFIFALQSLNLGVVALRELAQAHDLLRFLRLLIRRLGAHGLQRFVQSPTFFVAALERAA